MQNMEEELTKSSISLLKYLADNKCYFKDKSSFDIFNNWSHETGILSAEKELEYIKNAQSGDKEAMTFLIENNLKYVISLAKKYQNRGLELSDLVQEGNIGLMKGLEKFDTTLGFRLSTYVTNWIIQGMTRAIANQQGVIRIPVHEIETYKKVTTYISEEDKNGRKPSIEKLSQKFNLPKRKIENLLNIPVGVNIASLNKSTNIETEEEEMISFIKDSNTDIENDYIRKESLQKLKEYMNNYLTDREKNIIILRYGLATGEKMTLKAIGKVYSLTRERVRQIESRAIKKLQRHKKKLIDINIE